MLTPENHFDQTIWDPIDPERAIEDPMHGPSAVQSLLQIPPMPRGDGTYYRAGGFYAFGSVYVDARDQPIYAIGTSRSTAAFRRELYNLEEWQEAAREGKEALTRLETRRQQERLATNGIAHAFKLSDVCAGGQRLEDCETASSMMESVSTISEARDSSGRIWSVPAWLGRTCLTCSLHCEIAIQTQDGKPTGITRFSNTHSLATDFSTIQIDLPEYDA